MRDLLNTKAVSAKIDFSYNFIICWTSLYTLYEFLFILSCAVHRLKSIDPKLYKTLSMQNPFDLKSFKEGIFEQNLALKWSRSIYRAVKTYFPDDRVVGVFAFWRWR